MIAATQTPASLTAGTSEAKPDFVPTHIKTLDQREFKECQLIRAEPDALLIRHKKGIARLSFSVLNKTLKDAFRYNPDEAYKAAYAHYEKERHLEKWKLREEEIVRAMRKHEIITEVIKTTRIAAEATVLRATDDGIYVAAMQICQNDGCGKILKPFGPGCLFLPENSRHLRPGSLWKGYICPPPDYTVLDLYGEMFTVPFHKALTIGCENTGER
jgi:hypothetical protein|tara:strand:+ start:623 stop:1267 length:645 start_codon:yes stop_codon:yes gene_type:complete